MDNKTDLFDLKREKQELDQFLSTIADSELPASLSLKGAIPATDPRPTELKKPFDHFDLEQTKLSPKTVPEKPAETFRQIIQKDMSQVSSENAFMPKFGDSIPIRTSADGDLKQKAKSSFLPGDEEEKDQSLHKITIAHGVKPLESLKTMPRFGGSSYFEEKEVPEPPQAPEKKIPTEAEPEKKTEPAVTYDYAPEKKKIGKGKMIWILLVVVVALLGLFFWLYPETAGELGDTIKTSVPGSESVINAGKSLFSASAPDVNLVNVRQRLVHNVKLGKSIRVIEGVAENASQKVISRVKISAVLYDAGGSKLVAMESLGGNILIDEKLETLDANAMQSALQAGKGAEDKIPPKGQIPFMIVFTTEPAGVFKMSVSPLDFEKN
jgi:hypothetical protein